MHRFGRRGFILLLSLCPLLLLAGAGAVKKGAVTAELVAKETSIQPGRPFWVALKLVHDEHWHSYWINPGTGYPTSLTWTLPPGFSASPITWPTPHVVKDISGKVTGLGYEGEVWFFSQITPPASLPSKPTISLRAKAEWLMCKDVCMPGDAQLELVLPVGNETPGESPAITEKFDTLFGRLPKPDPAWTVSAVRSPKVITLHISSAAGSAHPPKNLHFFDRDGLLDYAAPQVVHEDHGAYVIDLAVSPDAKPDTVDLAGVLASDNGWKQEDEGYGGIEVDVPFGSSTAQKSGTPSSIPPLSALTPPPAATDSLAGTLFFAFVGGLILNLMPCVFPVLGIKILGFVNQAGNHKAKVVQHGLVFALGVLLSFWALAGVLLILRAGGSQLGWGFQLQSPAFVFAMASFLLIFALNMSGLFEIGLSATGAGANLQMQEGFVGSFFTGALATLVATPCSAPFLAPALGAALTLSPIESLLVFTTIAIGLSLPYLLLSIFPHAIKFLPRPGAWMETFKQLMAFPLYATVGSLLWVLAGQTSGDDYALLLIVFGFVLIAMAGWVYGRFGQAHGKKGRQWFGRITAGVLLTAGLLTGWPKEIHATPAGTASAGFTVNWEKWSPEAIASAQKAGHFVYVDFTARWCATCQTNKAAVFHSDAVLAEFGRRNVLLLRGDWTSKDPAITAELARWNRSAVPFNLIYAPNKPSPVILPELLTPGKVLTALDEAAK